MADDVYNESDTFDIGGERTVHRLGFGAMRLTGEDIIGRPDDEASARSVVQRAVELGVDSIDLFQFHRPDPDTDFEESVHAFAEMKDAGQVDNVGLSNVTVEQLETARDIVDIATVQNQYNVAYRDDEDVLQACEEYDVGFIPWGPLYTVDDEGVAGVLDRVGEAHDASRRQVALAWLLHHSDVTLPIPGTSSVDHLESNVAASQVELSDDDLTRLDEIDPQ